VRQHGVKRLGSEDNLSPTLEARSGSRVVKGTAAAYSEEGWKGFRGSIVFPATGEWQVTINSGFGGARAVLRGFAHFLFGEAVADADDHEGHCNR